MDNGNFEIIIKKHQFFIKKNSFIFLKFHHMKIFMCTLQRMYLFC